jgi:conjugal transfer/entry exclusion protein
MFVLWQDRKSSNGGATTDSLKFELLELDDSAVDNQKTRIQNEIKSRQNNVHENVAKNNKSKFWNKLRKTYVKKTDPLNKEGTNVFSLMGIRNLLRQYKKT